MTLEQLRDQFAEMLTGERATRWAQGELVCAAIRATGDRTKVFRDFASVGHCTTAYVRQLAEVYAAFPDTDQHKPDVAWSLYRACVNAGRRNRCSAAEVLAEALSKGWHVKEVSKLGSAARQNGRITRYEAECGACGSKVVVRATVPFPSVPCPICVCIAWEDQRDGRDGERIPVVA